VATSEPHSRPELEEFFELSVDLLCIVGFDGKFKRVSPSFLRTLGYSEEQLSSRSALDITHPDDVQRSAEALGRLAEGHDVVGFQSRVICADGSLRWLEWNTRTSPERGVVYGVARDATDRRLAEAKLQHAQRTLEESRNELRLLADEQVALRRVATLVARETPPEAVFAAVVLEVGELLDAVATAMGRFDADGTVVSVAKWGSYGVPLGARYPLEGDSVSARVLRTGRPARIDGYDRPGVIAATVRGLGIRFSIGVPISVQGRTWGVMIITTNRTEPLPPETESRLEDFTELVATAIANASVRAEIQALADEQAALRRVATMVAQGAPGEEFFAAVAGEISTLFGVDAVGLGAYHDGKSLARLAKWPAHGEHPSVPDLTLLAPGSLAWEVARNRVPARKDDWAAVDNASARLAGDQTGARSSVAAPIGLGGKVWGMIAVHSDTQMLPPETEARLERFSELVAIALANAEARSAVRTLADEQAALRRVATLVAQQTGQAQVFAAIAEEIGRLLRIESIRMVRYEDNRFGAIVASAGPMAGVLALNTRIPLEGNNIVSLVFHDGRTARLDNYAETATGPLAERLSRAGVRSVVGTPIMVEGQLWGAILAIAQETSLPAGTESRISEFTELMATAIANAEARAEVTRLADEQAALRRVATLVAQGANPGAVFDTLAREVAALLDASVVVLGRHDDDALTVVADSGTSQYVRVGDRFALGGANVTSTVLRTGRTARLDDFADATGAIGEVARDAGVRSTVGAPIVVDGRTWGVLAATWDDRPPPPDEAEERMARFAELLDTAIANADSRDQLTASRARVLAAGDDARRRVVRDLHDGAQQRLVQTIIALKLAQRARREDGDKAMTLLAEALVAAERATSELRELAHGILPSLLTNRGLRAAVEAFVARTNLPVDVDMSSERLPPDIEASAYFIVAEALTNVVKHAGATQATVSAAIEDDVLVLEVRDDGGGGADLDGHGLRGMADRVDALGGVLRIDSPEGHGTTVAARLPLLARWLNELKRP
jgi:PAS domain S-box-containing protein